MLMLQMTGLSGAGKSTVAQRLAGLLSEKGYATKVIDGDAYRQTLCKGLGFSPADRRENIRRLAAEADAWCRKGFVAVIAAINPYANVRALLRERYHAHLVWVHCPLQELIRRDTKGLYRRALLPEHHPDKLHNLTGINDAYETPQDADLVLNTLEEDGNASAERLLRYVLNLLPPVPDFSSFQKDPPCF